MTAKTYQELFHYMMFPVCAVVRDTGHVIYKNLACNEYLPKLSKRASIYSSIVSQNFTGSGAVKLIGSDRYHTAIVFEDGDHSVFLFPACFQCERGILDAARIFQSSGPCLADFLVDLRLAIALKSTGSISLGIKKDLYEKSTQLILEDKEIGIQAPTYLYHTMTKVFTRLDSVFSSIGYHVNARIEEDFPQYLRVNCSVQDILFVLGRLIYLQCKLSKTKDINILLINDLVHSQYVFHINVETNLSKISTNSDEIFEFLMEFIPECKMEFSLLHKTGLLTTENFTAHIDKFGHLTLSYGIPYISPETFYVRSMDMSNFFILHFIDDMIDSILEKLTDNGASC